MSNAFGNGFQLGARGGGLIRNSTYILRFQLVFVWTALEIGARASGRVKSPDPSIVIGLKTLSIELVSTI